MDSIADANLNTTPGFTEFIPTARANASASLDDPTFLESNTKHSINGLFWCNWHSPPFPVGSRVRWVFSSIGAQEGLHAPLFAKFLLVDAKGPRAAAQLLPGLVYTADMVAGV
jgi:hypothetical protein